MCTTCFLGAHIVQNSIRFPKTRFIVDSELPCGRWQLTEPGSSVRVDSALNHCHLSSLSKI